MTIAATDIKLLESERMRDTSDGGGRQTGHIIPSGTAGNVFPKVSRVDSVYGRVNLRKIYVAVQTANLDIYAGSHAIITDAPDNEKISCALFTTNSSFDTRAAARDRIESYVVAGPLSRLKLYGNQILGQKAITCYQRVEEPLPDIGDVLVLSVEATGYTAVQQFVRITDVTHEVRNFTDVATDFTRRIVTMKIGSSLTQTFVGAEITRLTLDSSPTKIRITQVADASKYYGIQPLIADADSGDLNVILDSVYAPLVPSTQRETAISLASIGAANQMQASSAVAAAAVTVTINFTPLSTVNVYLRTGIVPGSLVVTAGSGNRWDDNSDGTLTQTIITQAFGLTADYAAGVVAIQHFSNANFTLTFTINRTAAVNVSSPAHTKSIDISLSTRGTVYSETLGPLPAPGSVVVDFRALGRWYRFRDNGLGLLVANNLSEGTGTINYATGALLITLGALPDIDSAVIISWGSPAHYTIRAGATTDAATTLKMQYTLAKSPVVPGSVTISYPVNGSNRNVTDDSSGGLSGTGVSGTINYATGDIVLNFSTPPDHSSSLSNAYTWRDGASLYSDNSTTATVSGGTFTVPGTAPFRNGGTFNIGLSGGFSNQPGYITSGGAIRITGRKQGHTEYLAWADQQIGTFNATTGVGTITNAVAYSTKTWTGAAWIPGSGTINVLSFSDIHVERSTSSFDPNAITAELVGVSNAGLQLDITASTSDNVIANSLAFAATGLEYYDRNGILYSGINNLTGSGLASGTVDYETGIAKLTYWADNAAVSRTVTSCLTIYGQFTAIEEHFRIAGSPIRPASLYIQVVTKDGDLITGTADVSGTISGAKMRGTVQQEMGLVFVEFGEIISSVWTPIEVQPGTLRYNSVVLTNLPLDASILGLDPVRLPADGRVPIYRPGDVVVLHNTQSTNLTNPVTAGSTYSVGRTDVAVLYLTDADGTALASDRYAVNLVTGQVTIAADWSGSGVAQPLKAVHRIEQMNLVSDVQINGLVSLTAPLNRDYPEGSLLSGALLFGDMQAIVTNVFDQQTWTGVWADALIGSQATAEYNLINYPIEILNNSSVTDRWRINFTSATAFQVISENLGVIGTGSTSTDLTPVNPVTSQPYFTLRAAGWGSGWATGNNLRFNTIGANAPVWIARTILAGATLEGDSFDIEARGDVD